MGEGLLMDVLTYRRSVDVVKALRTINTRDSWSVVALNIALTAVGLAFIVEGNLALRIAGIGVLALAMNQAYLIVHECGHGTFMPGRRLNLLLGHLFAVPALLPFHSRQNEHAVHHRMTGTFKEPSTERAMNRFRVARPMVERIVAVCWRWWIPLFAINEHVMLWGLWGRTLAGIDARRHVLRWPPILALLLYVAAATVLFMLAPLAVTISLLAAVYLYMMLIEFFNLPHHLFSPIEDRGESVPYYEQVRYSKSCKPLPGPLAKWLTLNFNYHIAHHLYPYVPWMNLAEAHTTMARLAPQAGTLESEWALSREMRAKPIRIVFAKYYAQQMAA